MDYQASTPVRCNSSKLPLVLALLLFILIACWGVEVASAPDQMRLVNLGEDRHLLIRATREGLVLHFMGRQSSPDDNVILLPNRTFISDARWLSGASTVVVAAGQSETPDDIYGFGPKGQRFFRLDSQHEEGVRLQPLPGGHLVVVSTSYLSQPPEVLDAGWGEWLEGYLSWPWKDRDSSGRRVYRRGTLQVLDDGLVVMIDREDERMLISAQHIAEKEPLWEGLSMPGTPLTEVDWGGIVPPEFTGIQTGTGRIGGFLEGCASERRIVLSGGGLIASLDRESGEVLAAVRFPGSSIKPVMETKGDRLLAILKDNDNRGHLLVLDQSTLAVEKVIPNPGGWFVQALWTPAALSSPDGSVSLVPDRILGPWSSEAYPRSLVVTWGKEVGVHWLDWPAGLTEEGDVRMARRLNVEGGGKRIRIEEWHQ